MKSSLPDFVAFPVGVWGFHSGWNGNKDPTKSIAFSPRRHVNLELIPPELVQYHRVSDFEVACSFYVKTSHMTGVMGLSSGAGSAILKVRREDAELPYCTVRLKRCGFREQGLSGREFWGSEITVTDGRLVENAGYDYAGVAELDQVLLELHNASCLLQCGINTGVFPLGYFDITKYVKSQRLGISPAFRPAAAVFGICSDLRLDELISMAMSPMLSDLSIAGLLRFDEAQMRFLADGLCLDSVFASSIYRQTEEKLSHVCEALGAKYRELHKAGFLRGYGNCWMGNEVVEANGSIDFVDLDVLQNVSSIHRSPAVDRVRRAEFLQARSNLFDFYQYQDFAVFAVLATSMTEAFESGYRGSTKPAIDSSCLDAIYEHYKVSALYRLCCSREIAG